MTKIVAAALALCLATSALAASPGVLEKDANSVIVQGPAPNGLLSQVLTGASTTIDMRQSLWWDLYTPADCKYRLMPSAAKGAYPQFTWIGGSRQGYLRNLATPFVNFSSCASGELQRQ